MGYGEVLDGKVGIGGPTQSKPRYVAFILWCPESISGRFEKTVNLGLNKLRKLEHALIEQLLTAADWAN